MSKKWLLIIGIILTVSLVGCTWVERSEKTKLYQSAMTTYLKEKYNTEFEMTDIKVMIRGDSGSAILAYFRSIDYPDEFEISFYPKEVKGRDVVEVEGVKYYVREYYSAVFFRNQLLEELGTSSEDDCIVKCYVDYHGGDINREEFQKGIEECVKKAHIGFYIMAKDNENSRAVQEKAEDLMIKYNPDTANTYYAVRHSYNAEQIKSFYAENWYDFSSCLEKSEMFDFIEYRQFSQSHGLEERYILTD